ncbi:MAG: hypothetical protein QOI06_713 [Nocardioidaceae bacterium]|nr:hypothetical protein [Nocardioidaceae bacterium]
MGVVDAVLAAGARSRPAIVHVVGEPGLGKTRLLGEACERARALGMLVLAGLGETRQSGRLFGAITEPFASYVAERPGSRHPPRATPMDDPDLLRLVALAQESSDETADVGARAVSDAVRRALTEMARHRPVLLCLDDVQWSDEGSLDILAALSRHPPRAGVVIVLGYRPVSRLGSFADVRPGRIEGPVVGSLHRLELSALSESQLAELFPDATAARRRSLYAACGGNPFYLQAVNATGTDIVVREQQGADWLPAAVRAALAAELDALDPRSRRVAATAAVVGGVLDPDLLARVAGMAMGDVLDALDVLSAGMICRAVAPGRWQFRHPMLARVAYDAQPTSSRFRAHQAAALELARRSAPLAERAQHLVVASTRGDISSAKTIAAAADQLAGHAPGQAAAWYAVALDIAPQADVPWLEQTRLSRARALASVGRLDEARAILHTYLATSPASNPDRITATALAARVAYLLGQHQEAEAILQRELLSDVCWPPEAMAALHVELATSRLMNADFPGAREAAERALKHAPASEQLTVAGAASTIALSGAASGDVDLALQQRDAAARLVDGLSDGELARALEVGVWLGWAEMFLEYVDDARRHLERCLTIARSGAHQHLLVHLLVGWGSVLKVLGDLDEATEAYDEARESAERVGSRELTTMAIAMQCRAATWRGDVKAAQRLGTEAIAGASDRANWFASVAAALLAQARLAGGDSTGCVDAILHAGGGPGLPRFDPASRCDWWEVAVHAAVREDDLAMARDLSFRARECAEGLPLRGPQGFAALAEARVRLAEGEATEAAGLAAQALTHFTAVGNRLDGARAACVEGLARAASGDRGGALRLLADAEAVFGRCRAGRLRAEARVELRRLGRRVSASSYGAPGRRTGKAEHGLALTALSARERQVAELVAAGMTNRQIAGELVVSEKTVESHLGHIFVKLDVLSRASVAAAVAQRQPEPGEPAGDPRGRSLASPVDDKRPVRPPGRPPARR